MTVRTIQWIADSGLLVGLTTIGEFLAGTDLAELSLSTVQLTLAMPTSGTILGASPGSVIVASGLPAGLTINGATWVYDGSGVVGSYTFSLIETLSGIFNSPNMTTITITIAPAGMPLDFSQPADSGVIAAIRSF